MKQAINKQLPDTFNFLYKGRETIYTATHVPEDDEWVCSGSDAVGNSYTRWSVNSFLASGTWKLVEPKKSLPSTFKFIWMNDDTITYEATELDDGDFRVFWKRRDGTPNAVQYTRKQVEINLKHIWTILKCENEDYDEGNTANTPPDVVASIYEPLSFLAGAMGEDVKFTPNRSGKSCISGLLKAEHSEGNKQEDEIMVVVDECCEDISLLDYIKSFTENTGASVSIIEGTYTVIYNDVAYNADCDCELTSVCDAVTTLHLADFN